MVSVLGHWFLFAPNIALAMIEQRKKNRAQIIDAAMSHLQTAALLLPAKGPWREEDKKLVTKILLISYKALKMAR